MWIAIGSFVIVFLLIASLGMLVFYREAMLQRISEVINPSAAKKPKSLLETIQQTGISIGGVVEHFDQVHAQRAQAEVSITSPAPDPRRISQGKPRSMYLYGSKVLTPLVLLRPGVRSPGLA
jgi:tight adherence protein C